MEVLRSKINNHEIFPFNEVISGIKTKFYLQECKGCLCERDSPPLVRFKPALQALQVVKHVLRRKQVHSINNQNKHS